MCILHDQCAMDDKQYSEIKSVSAVVSAAKSIQLRISLSSMSLLIKKECVLLRYIVKKKIYINFYRVKKFPQNLVLSHLNILVHILELRVSLSLLMKHHIMSFDYFVFLL